MSTIESNNSFTGAGTRARRGREQSRVQNNTAYSVASSTGSNHGTISSSESSTGTASTYDLPQLNPNINFGDNTTKSSGRLSLKGFESAQTATFDPIRDEADSSTPNFHFHAHLNSQSNSGSLKADSTGKLSLKSVSIKSARLSGHDFDIHVTNHSNTNHSKKSGRSARLMDSGAEFDLGHSQLTNKTGRSTKSMGSTAEFNLNDCRLINRSTRSVCSDLEFDLGPPPTNKPTQSVDPVSEGVDFDLDTRQTKESAPLTRPVGSEAEDIDTFHSNISARLGGEVRPDTDNTHHTDISHRSAESKISEAGLAVRRSRNIAVQNIDDTTTPKYTPPTFSNYMKPEVVTARSSVNSTATIHNREKETPELRTTAKRYGRFSTKKPDASVQINTSVLGKAFAGFSDSESNHSATVESARSAEPARSIQTFGMNETVETTQRINTATTETARSHTRKAYEKDEDLTNATHLLCNLAGEGSFLQTASKEVPTITLNSEPSNYTLFGLERPKNSRFVRAVAKTQSPQAAPITRSSIPSNPSSKKRNTIHPVPVELPRHGHHMLEPQHNDENATPCPSKEQILARKRSQSLRQNVQAALNNTNPTQKSFIFGDRPSSSSSSATLTNDVPAFAQPQKSHEVKIAKSSNNNASDRPVDSNIVPIDEREIIERIDILKGRLQRSEADNSHRENRILELEQTVADYGASRRAQQEHIEALEHQLNQQVHYETKLSSQQEYIRKLEHDLAISASQQQQIQVLEQQVARSETTSQNRIIELERKLAQAQTENSTQGKYIERVEHHYNQIEADNATLKEHTKQLERQCSFYESEQKRHQTFDQQLTRLGTERSVQEEQIRGLHEQLNHMKNEYTAQQDKLNLSHEQASLQRIEISNFRDLSAQQQRSIDELNLVVENAYATHTELTKKAKAATESNEQIYKSYKKTKNEIKLLQKNLSEYREQVHERCHTSSSTYKKRQITDDPDATLRPSMHPQQALSQIRKGLKMERNTLRGMWRDISFHMHNLDPEYNMRGRKALEADRKVLDGAISNMSDCLYKLKDVTVAFDMVLNDEEDEN
ncbi:hypothetical protein BJ875DRAFT_460348 [Amylocarpus encephaloides]|uniref:Cep57 centrosome microtubule-binding domain-containing protein n=1 Tax=Amylocarpus encephaloides TaxID=45428 RepID=A0A9P8C5P9_9HELO|nr:hypothetical protein BJ875DRAFT_460348 [Amylocarpus encephaloides]